MQKLNLRAEFVSEMIGFYEAATLAKMMNISFVEKNPDIFKQEAWKYAKMFGDGYIYFYNKHIG